MSILALMFSLFTACDSEEEDPCAGLVLPSCPEECPEDFASTCGEPCEADEADCGNSIGDGRTCVDGSWSCTVHAPLEPDACNWVCDPDS